MFQFFFRVVIFVFVVLVSAFFFHIGQLGADALLHHVIWTPGWVGYQLRRNTLSLNATLTRRTPLGPLTLKPVTPKSEPRKPNSPNLNPQTLTPKLLEFRAFGIAIVLNGDFQNRSRASSIPVSVA